MQAIETKIRGALPTFFKALCREASQGGAGGYSNVGYKLAATIGSMQPYELDEDTWASELETLEALIRDSSDEQALAWLEQFVPRCMNIVPRRRRKSLLEGIRLYVIKEGNAIEL